MNILTLNCGSSSVKASLHAMGVGCDIALPQKPLWSRDLAGGTDGLHALAGELHAGLRGNGGESFALEMVGHRVVHGGAELTEAVVLTPAVHAAIARASALAPMHNAPALAGIDMITELVGADVVQVAAFDTAFHSAMAAAEFTYAGPREWVERGIRRYGFHGVSHRYASRRAGIMCHRQDGAFRVVTCHLGGGSSLAAVQGGRSVDTTMGFTPLDGLPMATRSGAVDPGIIFHLLRTDGATVDQLEELLSHHSGLAGLSDTSGDMRAVLSAVDAGDSNAMLAVDVYVHHVRKGIASMAATMGGLEALVFTGGIGEHLPDVRKRICAGLDFLGVDLDIGRNSSVAGDAVVNVERGDVAVLAVHSEENWVIACDCALLSP